MTPTQFEATHRAAWDELAALLERAERGRGFEGGARLAELYRRTCEHLALARSRGYPLALVERLEVLALRAHQILYRHRDYGIAAFRALVLIEIPQTVRALKGYVWASLALFGLPLLLAGWSAYADESFARLALGEGQLDALRWMYGSDNPSIGRARDANTDFQMLGHYIWNNISIGFRCFASGLLAGVGSVVVIAFNGTHIGAAAGFITAQGYTENFYSFVITHGAFELTGIVLAGAAGLRLGHALWAPGRRTRLEALKHNARDAVVVVYGVFGLLLIAAFVEAFWSSSRWLVPGVKYFSGALCWAAVLAYLILQGRPRAAASTMTEQRDEAQ